MTLSERELSCPLNINNTASVRYYYTAIYKFGVVTVEM